ncbi:MAG TPA: hypothetical protein VIX90_10385 [Edaphobacter sp.]
MTDYSPLPPLELTPPANGRSPALAFTLSLLFPGFGHFYIGLKRNAAWIAGIQALALVIAFSGSGTWFYQAMLVLPSLYCFAAADAYFGAREWNAGATSRMTGNNPRIAAVLNFLTKGWGYFYLGERTKGIVCFLIVSVVQALLSASANMMLTVIGLTLQIAIAVDVYRAARHRLYEINPELKGNAVANANPGGLPPTVVMATVLLLAIVVVFGYGSLYALNGKFVTKGGQVDRGPDGLKYTNARENVSLTAPADWDTQPSNHALVFMAGDGCSVILLDQYSPAELTGFSHASQMEILKQHPDGAVSFPAKRLNGRDTSSFAMKFNNKKSGELTQTFLQARHGVKIFSLIETSRIPACQPEFDVIEKSIRF